MYCGVSLQGTASHLSRVMLLCGLSGSLLGCGDRYPMAPVRGTVKMDGQPLTVTPPLAAGTVTFVPESPDTPFAYGEIGPDGTYVMATPDEGEGVVLGKYRVMVGATEAASDDPEAAVKRLTPFKYSSDQSSGLTAEVKEGENVIDFELESKK